MGKKSKNLIDFLYILIKWRKLIIINFLIVSILAAGVSLIMPHVYEAHTKILPPSENAAGLGLSSLLSNIPMGGLGMGAMSGELFQFISILNSRTIMESAAEKFNLVERYKQENMEETVRILRENVSEDINDDGTLSVSCKVRTKWIPGQENIREAQLISMEMTNFFIQKMDSINKHLKIKSAKSYRIKKKKRYQENVNELRKAENELKQFQETHGTIALEQQTQATIAAAAEIKSQIIAKQIELDALGQNIGPSNLQLQKIKNQVQSLQNTLDDFYSKQDQLFISLGDAPDLQIKYGRLMREMMLQQKIMEFLLPQYEQAKLQEAKDTPTVQVLDEAVRPIKRSKPKRSLFVIFWAFLSVLLSVFLVLTIEYVDNQKHDAPENHKKLVEMTNMLKNDLRSSKNRR